MKSCKIERVRRLGIILSALAVAILTACGGSSQEETRAKNILEKKYQKDFEIVQVYPQKLGEGYYSVQARAVEEPYILFSAYVDNDSDNCSDTYVERIICAKISEQIEQNLKGMSIPCFLFTHAIGPQPVTEDTEISIEDYWALDEYNRFQIEVFVPEEESGDYDFLSGMLNGMEHLPCDAKVYAVSDEEMDAVKAYFEGRDAIDYEFNYLTADFQVICIL